jgi:hypothetical protein
MTKKKDTTLNLDAAVRAIKEEPIEAQREAAAVARVRQELLGQAEGQPLAGALRGCADIMALLPAFRRNELAAGRRLVVEDHLRECVTCRQQAERPSAARVVAMPWQGPIERGRSARWGWQVYALAATLLIGISFGFLWRYLWGGGSGQDDPLYVQAVSGGLYRIAASGQQALQPGARVAATEKVRTGGGGHAIVGLADGSTVEMDERAQFAANVRGSDTTLALDRGNVIVQAAKRSRGHLFVNAGSCQVAVTGTVFAVSRGLSGSRVSVVEGEVRVTENGRVTVLHAGEQVTTGSGVTATPVAEEINWSRNREQHLKLLADLSGLQKDLSAVKLPGLRYESRLMGLVPADAVVYVAVPNYGETLAEAHALLVERLNAGGALRQWWDASGIGKDGGAKLGDAVEKLRALGGYIGEEIVFAIAPGGKRGSEPLVLAEVRREGIEEYLTRTLFPAGRPSDDLRVRIVDAEALGTMADSVSRNEALVLVKDGIVALAPRPQPLRDLLARMGTEGAFGASPFGARIGEAYRDGAGVLIAVDLQRTENGAPTSHQARYLILERKDVAGRAQHSADLAFKGPRTGIAAWLAPPAPMGSLDFVSPSAAGVAAFLHRNPALMLDDVLALGKDDSGRRGIDELTAQTGVSVRDEIAEALGGEIALALDGPVLPQPSWKLILEARDPQRIESAIQRLADALGRQGETPARLRLDREQVGAYVYHTLHLEQTRVPLEAHYTFVDGYLIVTPSRALLTRAIEAHSSGQTLAQSAAFRELLPAGTDPYCSGLLYQSLGQALAPLAQVAAPNAGGQTSGALAALAAQSKPTLFALYGEETHIRMAGTGAPLGLDISTLALPALLRQGALGTGRPARP